MPEENFLTEYEISRLGLDNYGALPTKMTLGKEHMMIGFFLITKILIGLILLQQEVFSGNYKPNKVTKV